MADMGSAALSGDDGALPERERALLERARTLLPRLAARVPAATAARCAPLRRVAGPVQPVLAHRRGTDFRLRLLGLGLCGAGRASMDHRPVSRTGAARCMGRRPAGGG